MHFKITASRFNKEDNYIETAVLEERVFLISIVEMPEIVNIIKDNRRENHPGDLPHKVCNGVGEHPYHQAVMVDAHFRPAVVFPLQKTKEPGV